MKLLEGVLDRIYNFYRYRVFPKVESRRGTTRILIWIEALRGKEMPKVDESEAFSPFEKDWENLIILDACRADIYAEVTGDESTRVSLGSSTNEYLKKNFSEGSYDDCVYISANPKLSKEFFEDLVGRDPGEVFHTVFESYREEWDHEKNTLMPEHVLKDAKTAKKLFSDKKLVIHFIQPHQPFIHMDYQSEGSWVEDGGGDFNIWREARKGKYSREELWPYYKKNLEVPLPQVEEIVEEFDGKTVITSDHGNLVGEMSLWGHPGGYDYEPLRRVPWIVED